MKTLYLHLILSIYVCLNAHAQDWQWQNPLPTGNGTNGAAWIDDQTFYVSGSKGQFVKTSDFGQSWETANIPTDASVGRLYFANASEGWAITNNGEIWVTEDAGTNWELQREDPATPTLRYIDVFNQSGYAGGHAGFVENVLIKTQNGGSDWEAVNLPIREGAAFYGLFLITAVNNDTVYAAGWDNTFFKSFDSGVTWDTTHLPISAAGFYEGGYFVNDSTGFLVGPNAYIVKTTDYGETWDVLMGSADSTDENSHYFTEVFFTDEQTGWVSSFGCLYNTTDGGETWTRSCDGTYGNFRKSYLRFNEQGKGIVVSVLEVFVTENGSDFDIVLPIGPTNTLYSINEIDGLLYAAASEGKIFQSTDGGENWSVMNTPVSATLRAARFVDQDNGWAAGSDSTILKTTDAGMTWELFDLDYNGDFSDLYAWSDSLAIVVGESGAIYKTTDGGASWTPGTIDTESDINAVHFANSDTGYVAGDAGFLARTIDGGTSWSVLDTVVLSNLNDIYFLDGKAGYTVGRSGRILFTNDAGATWTEQVSGESGTLNAVFFVNNDQGYVSTRGKVLITDDGGQNWTVQNTPSGNNLLDVYFDDEGNGWVVGSNGNILFMSSMLTDINDVLSQENPIKVFPNPADVKTTFVLNDKSSGNANLFVYDSSGRLVLNTQLTFQGGTAEWRIQPNMAAGLYYFQLNFQKYSQGGKLIIRK